MADDIIRVIRILVYEGERSWVERSILKAGSGTIQIDNINKVHAATLGSFPEVLVRKNEIRYACRDEKAPMEYAMWAGPYATKEEALKHIGQSDKSVIIKFDEEGTDDVILRWSKIMMKWIPAENGAK